jgi:hypothetical protein
VEKLMEAQMTMEKSSRHQDAEKIPSLGDLVWWEADTTEILRADFENRAQQFGVDVDLIPKPQSDGALTKALKALGTRHMIRRVVSDESVAVVALVDERRNEALRNLEYTTVQKVTYERASKALVFENGFRERDIAELFTRYNDYITWNEIRTTIDRVIQLNNGVKASRVVDDLKTQQQGDGDAAAADDKTDKRNRKGTRSIYFVPVHYHDKVQALANLIESLGNQAELCVYELIDSASMRKKVFEHADKDIEREAEALSVDVEELLSRGPGNAPQASTLKRRLDAFRRIREKARCYVDLIDMKKDNLFKKLRDLEQKVEAAL